MNQILEEQLSAALDGELPAAEVDLLLTRIDRTPESRAKLARYAMIGEYLRSGTARPDLLEVAENVRSVLISESLPAARPQIAPTWLVAAAVAASTAIVAFLITGPALRSPETVAVPAAATVAAVTLEEPVTGITTTANRRLNPAASARLTGYLVAHGEYAGELSRSSFDSRLVSARAERASWRQPQDADDAR
jgi:negative regulator of sigma E activity